MLNRRSFMKAIAPMGLLKGSESISGTLHYDHSDDLEVELTFPPCIYNGETGETRELDLSNPADAVLYIVCKTIHKGMGVLSVDIDYDAFNGWKRYCYEQNLKCVIITKDKDLHEILCELAEIGHACLYFESDILTVAHSRQRRMVRIGDDNG